MADAKQNALAALLQKFISPASTAGQLGSADAYRQYVIQTQESGQQPMSLAQFQQGGK